MRYYIILSFFTIIFQPTKLFFYYIISVWLSGNNIMLLYLGYTKNSSVLGQYAMTTLNRKREIMFYFYTDHK